MEYTPEKIINACQCCGTCCTKGGPALHREDRSLVADGVILLKNLFTIRRGELAYDNIQRQLIHTTDEIIKLKGRNGSWACRLLDRQNNTCRIYSQRPVECRLLKCWDSGDIETMYATERLVRKDLVGNVAGLWDLIADHEERCSYLKLAEWVKQMQVERDRQSAARIVEAINYDIQIRKLLAEQQNLDPELLDFLFGRPLEFTFAGFGYEIKRTDGIISFVPKISA